MKDILRDMVLSLIWYLAIEYLCTEVPRKFAYNWTVGAAQAREEIKSELKDVKA